MNCKRRLEDYLRENSMAYQAQHHPRAITARKVAATEHVPDRMFAKTVMVTTDEGEMLMLALPAPTTSTRRRPPRPLALGRYVWPMRSASPRPFPTVRSGHTAVREPLRRPRLRGQNPGKRRDDSFQPTWLTVRSHRYWTRS